MNDKPIEGKRKWIPVRDGKILCLTDNFRFLLDEPDLYDETYARLRAETLGCGLPIPESSAVHSPRHTQTEEKPTTGVDAHDNEILYLNDSFKFLLDEPDLYDEICKRLRAEKLAKEAEEE